MPAAEAAPLRVAECSDCGQLFALNVSDGRVACPACEAELAVLALEVAELGIAEPIATPAVEIEPAPTTFAAAAASLKDPIVVPGQTLSDSVEAPPEPTPEEPAATERPPTVAEWLRNSEGAAPTQAIEPEPKADDPAPSLAPSLPPSLAESLGLPGSAFRSEKPPTSPAEPVAPTGRQEAVDPPTSDFRFDFGATPLSDSTAEAADASTVNDEVSFQLSDFGKSANAADLETSDWTDDTEDDVEADAGRSGWGVPLSAVAGLLAIAAPAAYMIATWPEEGLDAAASRDRRVAIAEAAPDFGAEDAGQAAEQPPEPSDEVFVDTATQPASFEAPSQALPQALPPDPYAEADATTTPSSDPPADPFLAPAPAADDRYAPPAGDRYATSASVTEPSAFDPPEDEVAAMDDPAPPRPIERPISPRPPAVGLVNAPRYTANDLAAAISTGETAGAAFASGTLADPAQVSSMGQEYARLCYLAQVLTLLDPDVRGPDRLTVELTGVDVFKRVFRSDPARDDSRQIAEQWIAWTGRPHGGVFFAGTPTDVKSVGELIQYTFPVGGVGVPVVMAERMDVERFRNADAKQVGVIGVVVESPREWIAGYEGDAERVVWARKTVPLQAPNEL